MLKLFSCFGRKSKKRISKNSQGSFDDLDKKVSKKEVKNLDVKLNIELKKALEKIHVNCRTNDPKNVKKYEADRGEKKEKKEASKNEPKKEETLKAEAIPVCIKLLKVFL
jgi:hypothetical protein